MVLLNETYESKEREYQGGEDLVCVKGSKFWRGVPQNSLMITLEKESRESKEEVKKHYLCKFV